MYKAIATLDWHKQVISKTCGLGLFCFVLIAPNMWKSLTVTGSTIIHLHTWLPSVTYSSQSIIVEEMFAPCNVLFLLCCLSSSCTQRPVCPSKLCSSWPRQCASSLPPCGKSSSRGMCCNTLLWRSLWPRPVRPSPGSWLPDIRASWPWGSGGGWVSVFKEPQSLAPYWNPSLIKRTQDGQSGPVIC